MSVEEFVYVKKTDKEFHEAVVAVLKATEKAGWAVLQIHDMTERLAAKGFEVGKLKVVEICSAKHSSRLLGKDMRTSLCMPCKVNVYEDNGVKIATMLPRAISQIFGDMGDLSEVESTLKSIVNDSV